MSLKKLFLSKLVIHNTKENKTCLFFAHFEGVVIGKRIPMSSETF